MQKSNKSVQSIIDNSGNSFHSIVVKRLRDIGYITTVSPYYSDNFTGKPREIDIIADRNFPIYNIFNSVIGSLGARLFIECKYIKHDTVFWFDKKDMVQASKRIENDTELSLIPQIEKHHYYKNSLVAKIFDSNSEKSEDNQIIGKAINQCLNATIYYRNQPSRATSIDTVLKVVPYPLIIVNSFERFYSTNIGEDRVPVPITEPFQLEVNYAYLDKNKNPSNEYLIVDVVSIDKLENFLNSDIKENDVSVIKEKIIFNFDQNNWSQENRTNQSNFI
jgi:hypothetical protein